MYNVEQAPKTADVEWVNMHYDDVNIRKYFIEGKPIKIRTTQ